TGSWDAAKGTLTLSGTATVGQYRAALRSITYDNPSKTPHLSDRSVEFAVTDGSAFSVFAARVIGFEQPQEVVPPPIVPPPPPIEPPPVEIDPVPPPEPSPLPIPPREIIPPIPQRFPPADIPSKG